MSFFDIGIKILIIGIIIFFVVFANFCYHWADPHTRRERLIIAFMISFLYSCIIFPIGVIVLVLIDLIIKYFPIVIKILK